MYLLCLLGTHAAASTSTKKNSWSSGETLRNFSFRDLQEKMHARMETHSQNRARSPWVHDTNVECWIKALNSKSEN